VRKGKQRKVRGLHHVAVPVVDLAAAVRFYRETLGLPELSAPDGARERGIRWFDLGDGRALHLIPWKAPVPRTRAHFALSVEDLRSWRSHMEGCGVEMDRPLVDLYGIERFFVRDPSGNLIEFVQEAE
jgi:catechol 2,3-dioxygenase-like lactoylglutathione lyase family enzyme